MAKGKKYTDAAKRYDRDQLFSPAEALELAKRSMVRVRQASPFASLWIYRAKQEREAA